MDFVPYVVAVSLASRCYAASQCTNYSLVFIAVNVPVYLFLGIIPKIPVMHGVRVLGINSTAGIDDHDTTSPFFKKGM